MVAVGRKVSAFILGGIAMAFIIAGFLLVWIDQWRPLGSKGSSR